ncbi:hypothetical protein AK812_SmicGene2411 [Symbiodinium microadriaticum]|uniref:Uncharacterized protein n=1 Tax=Symbiodinium microadriaticum TaxID=2951 RepID=A0A1Q9F1I6_SYMMI|nr:hypothetical protein AK812_SmicGene2411 [Symbiodinium microadriaticum]
MCRETTGQLYKGDTRFTLHRGDVGEAYQVPRFLGRGLGFALSFFLVFAVELAAGPGSKPAEKAAEKAGTPKAAKESKGESSTASRLDVERSVSLMIAFRQAIVSMLIAPTSMAGPAKGMKPGRNDLGTDAEQKIRELQEDEPLEENRPGSEDWIRSSWRKQLRLLLPRPVRTQSVRRRRRASFRAHQECHLPQIRRGRPSRRLLQRPNRRSPRRPRSMQSH